MTELPDRLLREALREGTPAASSTACVDAEALAAWADGAMSGAARAAFERHAADCARCQALMAAMVRSAGSEGPADESEVRAAWWRRSSVSWLLPLAAAAAGIVIVVDLTMTERRAPVSQVARQEAPAVSIAPPSTPIVQAVPPPSVSAAPPAPSGGGGGAPRQDAASRRLSSGAIAQKNPPRAAAPPAGGAAADAAASEPRAKAGAEPAQPAPVPVPTASPAPFQAAAKDLAAPPAAAAAAGGMPARDEASKPEAMANRATALVTPKTALASARTVIVSPDREWQWRLVDGAVEQTHDAGRTWQPPALGETAAIRAGAAPVAHVCWLVGARGVVLLTTDGTTWRRIAFPDSLDLVAVQADDAARATVTTAAGRRYRTTDGGQTWTLVP